MIFEALFTFLMSVGLVVGFWLVMRRPVLWYFRINERIANQQKIIGLLEELAHPDSNA